MKNKRLLLFANDAASANMIIAYISLYKQNFAKIIVYAQNSAVAICKEHVPEYCSTKDTNLTFIPSDIIITGTSGLDASYEMNIIKDAKKSKVKQTISIVDNITNFEMRFMINGKITIEHLPDEIWVFQKKFLSNNPILNTRLQYKKNIYIQFLQKLYKENPPEAINPLIKKYKHKYLVILTEYIYELYGIKYGFTEYDMLEHILSQVSSMNLSIPIFLKLHPREHKNKFNILLRKYSHLNIFVIESNIQELIFYGKIILGINSSVFIECNVFNKPCFSVLIDSNKTMNPTFIKPHNIIHTKKNLKRILEKYFVTLF